MDLGEIANWNAFERVPDVMLYRYPRGGPVLPPRDVERYTVPSPRGDNYNPYERYSPPLHHGPTSTSPLQRSGNDTMNIPRSLALEASSNTMDSAQHQGESRWEAGEGLATNEMEDEVDDSEDIVTNRDHSSGGLLQYGQRIMPADAFYADPMWPENEIRDRRRREARRRVAEFAECLQARLRRVLRRRRRSGSSSWEDV